jgi:hypothetical protein
MKLFLLLAARNFNSPQFKLVTLVYLLSPGFSACACQSALPVIKL